MRSYEPRKTTFKNLAILGFITFCVVWLVLKSTSSSSTAEPVRILAKLPIGSTVLSVEPLLSESVVRGSAVKFRSDGDGAPLAKDLGDYYSAKASYLFQKDFSGEVILFLKEPLGNDTAVSFRFKKGHLIGKSWGYLPG